MKKVVSYQTSDEKLHLDAASAHTHQFFLDVRGIIQSNKVGRAVNITVDDVAQFVVTHVPELMDRARKYKEKMRHLSK